jgi:uncharacterized phiE125 gp8 family phage protein
MTIIFGFPMPLELVTPPALEPVTLADAKAYLKIDTPDEDALISTLITAARARAEWHTGRAFVAQSWILWLDGWREVVEIPLPPLRAVTAVTRYAGDGSASVLDPGDYFVDTASQPGRVALACVPPSDLRRRNALAIAFDAGYGDDADTVPAAVREAILAIVADLHLHRGEGPVTEPGAAQALLAPYKIFNL